MGKPGLGTFLPQPVFRRPVSICSGRFPGAVYRDSMSEPAIPQPVEPAHLHWVGSVAYPPTRPRQNLHCHDFHELVLVTSGTYQVELEGERQQILPGHGVVFRKDHLHRPHPDPRGCRIYVVQWHQGISFAKGATFFHDHQAEISTLCNWLWHRFPAKNEAAERHVDRLTDALLAAVQDQGTLPEQGLALDVAHYLQTAGHKGFALQELADFTGKSLRHVNRVFREQYGMSPMRFRRQAMLQRAVHLLCTTNLSVEEITDTVGYKNAQALARATRATYDRSPSQIRKDGVPLGVSMSKNE